MTMSKPRIGRPPNEAGHTYKMVGVSGTQQEIATVLDNLTPRERMEAMLAKVRNDQDSAKLQKALGGDL